MTTTSAELQLAIAHLLRAKELAMFYGHQEERVKEIDLIKRAACNVHEKLQPRKKVQAA
jgi:hypothetical protein